MGLDVYLYDGNGEKVERDSTRHPDNYNKVGYFRSSYNPSGINRKASNLGLPGLYDIFEPGGDYEFAPDWQGSLVRVKEALKQWRAKNEAGCYDAFAVNLHNADNGIQSEVDAIAYFRKHGQGEGAWSSRDMFYVGEGSSSAIPANWITTSRCSRSSRRQSNGYWHSPRMPAYSLSTGAARRLNWGCDGHRRRRRPTRAPTGPGFDSRHLHCAKRERRTR